MTYLTYETTQEARIAYIESYRLVHNSEPQNIEGRSRAWFCLQNHSLRRSV
jgi:hypothetical protein